MKKQEEDLYGCSPYIASYKDQVLALAGRFNLINFKRIDTKDKIYNERQVG